MKTRKILTMIFMGLLMHCAHSQNSVSEKGLYSNLPTIPNTTTQFRYFYYPNLQAYYDNLNRVFYYRQEGQWQTNETLPPNYGGYSIYNDFKVIINDFMDDKPYELIAIHKAKYPYISNGRVLKLPSYQAQITETE